MTAADAAETVVVVRNRSGLHARPSSLIAETAFRFRDTQVTIARGDAVVDAKSIMELLTLEAREGTELRIRASGPEARQAVDALRDLFERRFGLPN